MDKLTDAFFKIFPLRIMKYHNFRIQQFVQTISQHYDQENTKMLDVGAENSPYRKYFQKLKYQSQDIKQNKTHTIDIIGDFNEGLPQVKNESFDYILCTQVLEHLREPQKSFQEFNRILKANGKLFLTTHMCYDTHMIPYDYYRFTKYGLEYLGTSNGFALEHIAPHGGVFQVLARILDMLVPKLFHAKDGLFYYLYMLVFSIPTLVFNTICYVLDFLDREKTMTLNYECIYRKLDHAKT